MNRGKELFKLACEEKKIAIEENVTVKNRFYKHECICWLKKNETDQKQEAWVRGSML